MKPMEIKRILIVEDDAAIRRGLVDALGFAGYATLEASDGLAASVAALEEPCDLVLLDLVLPGRDGLEVLRGLRAARSPLPVIVPRRTLMWFSTSETVCGLIPRSAMPVAAVRLKS